MRAGELRRRITIQQRTGTLDNWGQQVATWTDLLANVPAAFEAIGGDERLRALQVQSEITYRVTLRYHAIFADPKQVDAWRLVYGARFFNIQVCTIVDERNRSVELLCNEGLNDGQ